MRAGPDRILRMIAIGLGGLAALAAGVELKDAVAPVETVEPAQSDEPLRATLARCRSLTAAEIETDTACQAAWAENRRRFFVPSLAADTPPVED